MENEIVIYDQESLEFWNPFTKSWTLSATRECVLDRRSAVKESNQLKHWYPNRDIRAGLQKTEVESIYRSQKNRGIQILNKR
jgi:hypothetical protein